MPIERRDRADRIRHERIMVHMMDRLRQAGIVADRHHPRVPSSQRALSCRPISRGSSRRVNGRRSTSVSFATDSSTFTGSRCTNTSRASGYIGPDGVEGEQVVGALHHPAPAGRLMLQVLQEAAVEPVGRHVAGLIQPAPVARDAIRRVEAQAAEDMRGDLAALLRRGGVERMQPAELRGQPLEGTQLPRHARCPRIAVRAGRSGYG